MHRGLFNLSVSSIEGWPEIFDDIYVNTMPVAYLNSIKLEFNNGRIWEFGITDKMSSCDIRELSNKVLETIQEYHTDIKKVNFGINVDKLKNDIREETKKLL